MCVFSQLSRASTSCRDQRCRSRKFGKIYILPTLKCKESQMDPKCHLWLHHRDCFFQEDEQTHLSIFCTVGKYGNSNLESGEQWRRSRYGALLRPGGSSSCESPIGATRADAEAAIICLRTACIPVPSGSRAASGISTASSRCRSRCGANASKDAPFNHFSTGTYR
jgi:hypothetical protein